MDDNVIPDHLIPLVMLGVLYHMHLSKSGKVATPSATTDKDSPCPGFGDEPPLKSSSCKSPSSATSCEAHAEPAVKYRPYTYSEAVNLLGEIIRYEDAQGYKSAFIVTQVDYVPPRDTSPAGEVFINGHTYAFLKRRNATIDGKPVGVPCSVTEAKA